MTDLTQMTDEEWELVRRSVDRYEASDGRFGWALVRGLTLINLAKSIARRKWRFVENWTLDSDQMPEDAANQDSRPVADIYSGNIVTSESRHRNRHLMVLDLDVDHVYIPSTTPGHGHLMINVPMEKTMMFKLLDLMAECGIVQRGYAAASKARGYSAIRMPWVKKVPEQDDVNDIVFDNWEA